MTSAVLPATLHVQNKCLPGLGRFQHIRMHGCVVYVLSAKIASVCLQSWLCPWEQGDNCWGSCDADLGLPGLADSITRTSLFVASAWICWT